MSFFSSFAAPPPPPILVGHTHTQRVAFVGPFGVGKTTALRAISDIDVVDTDVATTERRADLPGKTHTTVGFDYGELKLEDGQRIGLFGLPGQDRFHAVWRTVLPGASAVVLWIYGDQPDAPEELENWLQALKGCVALEILSVAVTRLSGTMQDIDGQLMPLRDVLARFNPVAPLIAADPRQSEDVRLAVAIALAAVSLG
jgi:signal recognition particle receptor subunit beta